MKLKIKLIVVTMAFLAWGTVLAEEPAPGPGAMTLERMEQIIQRIEPKAVRIKNNWQFNIEGYQVTILTDQRADRMRIIVPVESVDNIKAERLYRLMQANFDSALDARYSIAQDILWSAYIHPLAALDDEQFISGLGQVINLADSYGSSYSSGALIFQGGDSQELQQRELIDRLLKKGLAI